MSEQKTEGYNVVFRFTTAAGPLAGSMECMWFDSVTAFHWWYDPIKTALLNEVVAEGITDEEAENLVVSNMPPEPVLLVERMKVARQQNITRELTADEFSRDYICPGHWSTKEGLAPIGVVPLALRGLYLLALEIEATNRNERTRREVSEFGKLVYDNERMEFQIAIETDEDPLFAGADQVMECFAKELELCLPAIAPNIKRGRMFRIEKDWMLYSAPEIPFRDEQQRREAIEGAARLRALLGEE